MLSFLSRLFGGLSRVEAASDRVALAMEGIAEDLEQARAALRQRIGLDGLPAPAALPEPEAEDETHKNGRARKTAAK